MSETQSLSFNILDDPQYVDVLFGGSAGGAKSFFVCMWALMQCRNYPGIAIGLGRKSLKSLRQTTLVTLLTKVHPLLGVGEGDFRFNGQDNYIEYINGSKIILIDMAHAPTDPDYDRFGSLELTHVVVEEVGEANKKAVDVLSSRRNRMMNKEYGIVGKLVMTCIPEGGRVMTDTGYQRVESVDGKLLNINGEYDNIVQKFSRHVKDEDIYVIKTANTPTPLKLTDEHPVLVSKSRLYRKDKSNSKTYLDHNYVWTKPTDIEVGDWLRMPIDTDITSVKEHLPILSNKKNNINDIYKTEDFWWLVGYYIGDGYTVGKTNTIQFAVDEKWKNVNDRVRKVIVALGRKPCDIYCDGKLVKIQFTSKEFATFARQFGRYASGKIIPKWLENSVFAKDVVSGYLSADGCVTPRCGSKNKFSTQFVSINLELIESIHRILVKQGIVGHIKLKKNKPSTIIEGRTVNQKNAYYLYYGVNDTIKLRELIPDNEKLHLANKLVAHRPKRRNKCYIEDGYLHYQVTSVKIEKYTGMVYNFETESHTYVAESYTVHNCNPTQNFIRQEYYKQYENLGMGRIQRWPHGHVIMPGTGERVIGYRAFVRSSVHDNPFADENYIETLRNLPPQERKRLFEGNWDYADDDDSLFKALLLDRATAMNAPTEEGFDSYIGVDVADKGKDDTIATLVVHGIIVQQKVLDINMTHEEQKVTEKPISRLYADELIKFAQQNGFTSSMAKRIAVEGNGIGVGMRDALRERGWFITVYEATSQTRSQGYYDFSLDMDSGAIKILNGIDDGELRRQLAAHTYTMNEQKPVVKKKDQLKVDLGRSPDHADSAMIANFVRRGGFSKTDPRQNAARIRW